MAMDLVFLTPAGDTHVYTIYAANGDSSLEFTVHISSMMSSASGYTESDFLTALDNLASSIGSIVKASPIGDQLVEVTRHDVVTDDDNSTTIPY
jgi:hypothetical protein